MIELSGQSLTLRQIDGVANGETAVALSDNARCRILASREVVERLLAQKQVVYGVNTGFGKLADVHIPDSDLEALQLNLVRSHASGLGSPLPVRETRAMMLLRANVLALGYSGCRVEVVEALLAMLERGVYPVIPEKGSVGASGDLAPLAHLALVLIGEGEACYQGERIGGGEALRRARLTPLRLEAKEGLALLNGTQAMTAVASLALYDAQRLVRLADVAGAMSL